MPGNQIKTILRLDAAEALRSRWAVFSSLLYLSLAAVFILVGLRESAVIGFTSMGRVLTALCHMLLFLLPLLAVTATAQVFNRAREDGTLEFLFSQPLGRREYFLTVSAVRYGMLLLPLAVLFGVLALAGWAVFGQEVAWMFLARSLIISASLLWAFVGFGLAASTIVRNPARALVYSLLLWLAGVALLDFGLIGLMLQWQLDPKWVFLLASLNPVESARMALLSAADPTLAGLGPVGFFVANRLGDRLLFALGTAWPAIAGSLAWWIGRTRFACDDLV
jgi:ABC-type transport system involved in multi-copper enzyme maturation permease subunit